MSSQIAVLAELERIGWTYDYASDAEVSVCCPFHNDSTPSCSINLESALFKCQTAGCGASGDIIKFLARALNTTRAVVFADLSKRYTLDASKVINPEVVERFHSRIFEAKPLVKALYDRGVTDELIRKYRLGFDKGRITIPIANESGLYVNVRKYLPGAPGKDKMRNTKGHSQIRLYPISQMVYETIVLVGGEMKAIVGASQLNEVGVGCVTATGGEDNWDVRLNNEFKGKRVIVCYDVDPEGQAAAAKLCNLLSRVASWVANLVLPLDLDKYPHGDINDYVGQEHGNVCPLIKDLEEWQPEYSRKLDKNLEAEEMPLALACTAYAANKRVEVKCVVSAMDTAPYVVPSKVKVVCDRSQKECAVCAVYARPPSEGADYEIDPESQAILAMVGSKTKDQREACMGSIGIPRRCGVVEFEALEYFTAEDIRLSPNLEITNRQADRTMQPAIAIGKGLELNETYVMEGRMHPHPNNQQSTLVISKYETAQDALSSYEPTDLERLDVFKPEDGDWSKDGVSKTLNRLYADIEANVTRIYQRRILHLFIDLTYHSPLFIDFDGKVVKGWVETLIMGDSSQGKSETAMNLMRHYGLGEKAECKNASVAGLLGGLQQIGGKWFVTWGIIPTHDKRLVILEELKGASTEVIGKLTDMRSSGIAEIPKIEKRKTHARTRLIALSNTRPGQPMSAYNFGIEAIPELIGSLEDVRRFDTCLIVSASEVNSAELNQLDTHRPSVNHVYTDELCRALVLWSWTREPEDIVFEPDTKKLILERATELCSSFTDLIPIVDRGSMRFKLARLASALACRTFSTDESRLKAIVRPGHVEFVADVLAKVYSSDAFGYSDFTQAVKLSEELKDEHLIAKQINELPFPRDFVESMLHSVRIDNQDVQDWCGWDRGSAMQFVSILVRKRALQRDGRSYRKSPSFITFLKNMLQNGLQDRPDFITEVDEF